MWIITYKSMDITLWYTKLKFISFKFYKTLIGDGMDIDKILRTGYFDRIKIDGHIVPVLESSGTDIGKGDSFRDALDKSNDAFKHGVSNIRVNIFGEADTNISFTELENMREDRKKSGLRKMNSSGNIDRYLIAYVDILMLKNGYAIPYNINNKGNTEKDVEKLAKNSDMLDLYLSAVALREHIQTKYKYTEEFTSVAIINKVYVEPVFRRSGISKWIHLNIADIINMYGLMFPVGIVMSYGDFSNESSKLFGMNHNEYTNMLIKHYKTLGYRDIGTLNLPSICCMHNVLYKLFV